MDTVINGMDVVALIDTGATASILSEKVVSKWPVEAQAGITKSDVRVHLADEKDLTVIGEVRAELQLGGQLIAHKFIIADVSNDVLLGLDFLREENCIIDINGKSLKWRGTELSLRDTAEPLQCCRVTVQETVVVPPQTEMVIVGSLGESDVGVAYGLIEPTPGMVQRENLIVASSLVSTTEETVPVRLWNPTSDHVTLYKGATAGTFLTVDAVGPAIDTESDRTNVIERVNLVSTAESEAGYQDVEVAVPAHLQNLYEQGSKEIDAGQRMQLKELLVSRTFDEHLERLQQILARIQEAGLKLQPKKCHVLQRQVSYLGHIVSNEGVKTDPEKVQKVQNWPVPSNLHEVRSFLGLASYYRRFVPSFAELARPLHRLTEKGNAFVWSNECQVAFDALKLRLISSPVLAYSSATGEFILDTDASDYGIGAVLSQRQDGTEKVIAYASRALTKSERNYCVTRKELLALVFFVKHFRPYLYGQRFKLRTDHGALRWLFGFKEPVGQVARWLQVLAEYDFQIEHRPGRRHGNADAMSRMPCRQCEWVPGEVTDHDEVKSDCPTTEVLLPSKPGMEPSANDQQTDMPQSKEGSSSPTRELSIRLAVARVVEPNWLQSMTTQTLRKQQLQDRSLGMIIRWIESKEPKPKWTEVSPESAELKSMWGAWDQLCLREGALHKKWEDDTGDEVRYRLVVPRKLQKEVLQQLHNSPTGGHLGAKKLYEKAKA
ncbi:uncharacterized protein LOC119736660 [Patiria miniata]|uniref:RNA-directed DNA polymerase n=1 Tax=Patiria miniata TaxID=46514 RepID=A0A914ASZ9_PATMI|nr:uncharacterized protein LOC119736660 [Patiria miniata]